MSHKNAYEIRVELIHLAMSISFNMHAEGSKTRPTVEDVIEIATKLNEFVSKNEKPNS